MTALVLIFVTWFCDTFLKSFVMVLNNNHNSDVYASAFLGCMWVGVVLRMSCLLWGGYLKRPGDNMSTPCRSSWQASPFLWGSRKMAVFLKAPFFLEDIHFALVSLSFAHEKIHHCVYKCQIAMQIGICVPNYPFCVFAKRMCRQILQVWVGRPRGNLAPTESAPNKVMCPDSVWKEKAKRL